MALSQQVTDSLEEAQAALRNALAYGARNERPIVNQAIADLMCNIDKLKSIDKFLDTMEDLKDKKDNVW